MRDAELQGRLGLCQQLFEVLGGVTGHEVVVDVDFGFGEQALGLADFIRGPAGDFAEERISRLHFCRKLLHNASR